jgi:hypothetical protein
MFVASFIPTAKNALCASFLPDQGFSRAGGLEWRLPLAEAPEVPAHIEWVSAETAAGARVAVAAEFFETRLSAIAGK